ncbi:MAG TPA: class I SAM-dependent methyltransferase [Sediminibacterium sp.]|uniref:class I SAM-dependent methyltransferase n=1 Tax=Sediminibacterium sp. TaxID=1917865 RepID=UPI002CF2B3BC|nr:class I SAM-dependent methyltransferase [Sediminibacterium sp.]HQS36544.1 class I SAM-dependent methyltransferase [Sediminibacterium sp.]
MICGDCGMVFAAPMPSAADLADYNSGYFTAAHGGRPNSPVALAFFSGMANIRRMFVNRFLKKHNVVVKSILEVGPGPGYFASAWLKVAPQTLYYAIETDNSCHKLLSDMGVMLTNVMDAKSADLVIMSHVVEHVSDPVAFVRDATICLRAGGALFIEVPCQDWVHKTLDEPHILFFDRLPLQRMLSELGFTHIEISYYGKSISQLRSRSILNSALTKIRGKLLQWNLAPLFAFNKSDTGLSNSLEHAVVAPFKPHIESLEPAWWLRAIAIKA